MNHLYRTSLLAAMLLGGILVSNAQQTLTPASRMALRQMRAAQQENVAELYPASYRKVMNRMPRFMTLR